MTARRTRLLFAGFGALAAWGLWGAALGLALVLPGGALPLPLADLLAGLAASTVVFGGSGYLFGRVAGPRPEA